MDLLKCLPLHSRWKELDDGVAQIDGCRPRLSDLPTPLVVIGDAQLTHNVAVMADWARRHGFELAPHGKTTMSRQLWERQLEAGAWGITVATPWQLAQACQWGVKRVMLANSVADPRSADAICRLAATHELIVWADSVRSVEILAEASRRQACAAGLDVLVEIGATGARTGVRTRQEAMRVARAVTHAEGLSLRGVAAYEGALAHGDDEASLTKVSSYLTDAAALFRAMAEDGLFDTGSALLTAGGSCYLDLVSRVLSPVARDGHMVLVRSGATVTHDEGIYQRLNPFRRAGEPELTAATRGLATVISQPEPGMALLDGGRRDFPFDEGLPVPLAVRRWADASTRMAPVAGVEAYAINDQHLFVRWSRAGTALEVGDVVLLGLSHPCTTFDKWRALPVVDDLSVPDPLVVGLVRTNFG